MVERNAIDLLQILETVINRRSLKSVIFDIPAANSLEGLCRSDISITLNSSPSNYRET